MGVRLRHQERRGDMPAWWERKAPLIVVHKTSFWLVEPEAGTLRLRKAEMRALLEIDRFFRRIFFDQQGLPEGCTLTERWELVDEIETAYLICVITMPEGTKIAAARSY